MVCPKCESPNIFVIDSRTTTNNVIRRRRECYCGNRWNTYEVSAIEIKRINNIYKYLKKINDENGV